MAWFFKVMVSRIPTQVFTIKLSLVDANHLLS